MLVGILIVYFQCGSNGLVYLTLTYFSPNRQLTMVVIFLLVFVKAPLVPFHGWLPETHSNALQW
jgi:NADH:ubiquinone oxidoreductase subunit 4 (subunit M)